MNIGIKMDGWMINRCCVCWMSDQYYLVFFPETEILYILKVYTNM